MTRNTLDCTDFDVVVFPMVPPSTTTRIMHTKPPGHAALWLARLAKLPRQTRGHTLASVGGQQYVKNKQVSSRQYGCKSPPDAMRACAYVLQRGHV